MRVACDEMHAHSAQAGCLDGPQESIEICILWEEISQLQTKLSAIAKLTKFDRK